MKTPEINTAAIAEAVKREAEAKATREKLGRDAAGEFHGKKNIYVCESCFGHIVTVDRDAGVTPFMLQCKASDGCKGMMKSSLYRVFDQSIGADHEWFRPESVEGLAIWEKSHVSNGGLLLRAVTR